jgi:hypothetical protein
MAGPLCFKPPQAAASSLLWGAPLPVASQIPESLFVLSV